MKENCHIDDIEERCRIEQRGRDLNREKIEKKWGRKTIQNRGRRKKPNLHNESSLHISGTRP